MLMSEEEWERLLAIRTAGRDDSRSDGEHHPYEPTDYCVLERLANSGLIRKKNMLIDYGSGKGRVSIFLAYQIGCRSIGVEYDERLFQKAMINAESRAARQRVSFVLGDAATYVLPDEVDCCFFFNPFALHTLKRVLGNIFDSLQRAPRPLRLFFYYPYKDVERFLNQHWRLDAEEPVDCRDLFDGNDEREKILVYSVRTMENTSILSR